jgi:hypothetical protein
MLMRKLNLSLSLFGECNLNMADVTDDAREARRLVRAYSGDVEGRLPHGSDAHVLGQVLAHNSQDPRDIANPWRKFFDPPVDTEDQYAEIFQ